MRPYCAVSKRIFIKPIYRDNSVLERNWYCANIFGCRETGWRDPTGFLNCIYLFTDIDIYSVIILIYDIDCCDGLIGVVASSDSVLKCKNNDFYFKRVFKVIFENIRFIEFLNRFINVKF